MYRIAILDDYQNRSLQAAEWGSIANAEITVFNEFLGHDNRQIAESLMPFEVVVVMRERTRFPSELLCSLENLRLLVTAGMRNGAIDMLVARAQNIDVCGTEMLGYPAFEHTWALILALTKQLPKEDRAMKAGGWQEGFGIGLNGKTLGVIGLGKLGEKVANVGCAFGMKIVAWSPNLTQKRCVDLGGTKVTKEDLFSQSDVITIHMVLSENTRDLVGADDLAIMKPSSYLINTSRGPIVNEPALLNALRNKKIAGAGLDVFDIEPLPKEHLFRELHNVVLTGHTGYVVAELYEKVYGQAVENIKAWIDKLPIRLLNG